MLRYNCFFSTIVLLGISFFITISGFNLLYRYLYAVSTVVPQKVYRSHQLTAHRFSKIIKQNHLRSIINLRGAHPNKKWYRDEIAVSQANNISHYDIALSSKTLPIQSSFKELITVLDHAPKPLLIHCEGGVSRTSFAAMLSLILQDDHSIEHIKKQNSYHYFMFSSNSIGIKFLRSYSEWLDKNNLKTSRINFLQWLNHYPTSSVPK